MATTNKYDRQLRLWGSNGQKALSESVIILFSATSAGTESLKNLVLPGCGSFHIIDDDDDRQVVSNDTANGNGDGDDGKTTMTPFHNFFVFPEQPSQTKTMASGVGRREVSTNNQRHTFFVIPEDNINDDDQPQQPATTSTKSSTSKAEVATKNLMELNPDVVGGYTTLPSPLSKLFSSTSSDDDSNTSTNTSSIIYNLLNTIRIERKAQWNNLIILGADLSPGDTRPLADFCWNGHNTTTTNNSSAGYCPPIPLVLVRSYGLLGTVRVQIRDRPIIESKPENMVEDLRLASCSEGRGGGGGCGFSELWDLAEGIDLDALDERDHGHVPFVVILLKALDRWRMDVTSMDGDGDKHRLPKTFAEKNEFKSVIRSMSRDINKEVNFIEAMDYAYLAYTKMELSYETQCLLDASEATLTKKSTTTTTTSATSTTTITQFDLLIRALAIFINTSPDKKQTPLNGSIPDMASSTQGFVELQTLYRTKANSDKERMRSILTELVTEYPMAQSVVPDDEELTIFCKNVHCLRYISTRSYSAEYDLTYPDDDDDDSNNDNNNDSKSDIQGEIVAATYDPYEDAEQTPLLWYVALRACDSFWEEHGVWPGGDGRALALEGDAVEVQGYIKGLVGRMGFGGEVDGGEVENELIQSTLLTLGDGDGGRSSSKYAKEVVRYFNAELHNVASVVGGVASQEAVKLITGQYVPMDGTYVFNGIASVSGVYKF